MGINHLRFMIKKQLLYQQTKTYFALNPRPVCHDRDNIISARRYRIRYWFLNCVRVTNRIKSRSITRQLVAGN